MLLYVLLGGYLPYPAANEELMVDAMRERDVTFHDGYWEGVSKEAIGLVGKLLVRDPRIRVSASDALESDWFKLDAAHLEGRAAERRCSFLRGDLSSDYPRGDVPRRRRDPPP